MRRKKLAVLYPLFLGGGAEYVTAWTLQALRSTYDLCLITFSEIDLEQVDRQFGTSLAGSEIEVRVPYQALHRIGLARGYSLMAVRQYLLSRYYRTVRNEFALAISAFNEMDLGNRGIQYVHVPLFGHGSEKARRVLKYPASAARMLYQRSLEWLTGYSDERMRDNLTLTNSWWTADLLWHSHRIEAHVLYPPVVLEPPNIPWPKRENGFVCSGRISPDKNLETVIEVMRGVRLRGFDVHLHILSGSYDPKYRLKILGLVDANKSWLSLDENLSYTELAHMLARHRYGIHGRANETFGISIAEMVRAGCIPFVPAEGGQAEIVRGLDALNFRNAEEAIEKVVRVLESDESALSLRKSLARNASEYSYERFASQLSGYVLEMVK